MNFVLTTGAIIFSLVLLIDSWRLEISVYIVGNRNNWRYYGDFRWNLTLCKIEISTSLSLTREMEHDGTVESTHCEHSERLAIAFNLIQRPVPSRIQVTKNLRVCGYCREFFPLDSIDKVQINYLTFRRSDEIGCLSSSLWHHCSRCWSSASFLSKRTVFLLRLFLTKIVRCFFFVQETLARINSSFASLCIRSSLLENLTMVWLEKRLSSIRLM